MQESDLAIDLAQQRVVHLLERLSEAGKVYAPDLAIEALTEVEVALEELRVADERLREQNMELLRAHTRIDAERERYARLFDEAPEGYFVTDGFGVITQVNDMGALLLGARQRYLIGKPLVNYVAMSDRLELRQKLLAFVLTKDNTKRMRVCARIMPPGGRPEFDAQLEFSGFPSPAATDQQEIHWVMRDLSDTSRKDVEFYQLLVDVIQDYAIVVLDSKLRIVIWNRGAEAFFGYATAEAIGMDSALLFSAHHRRESPANLERLRALESGRSEEDHWYVRKDGSRFFGSGLLISLPGADPIRRFVKILRDVTTRKRSEESEQTVREDLERMVDERTVELADSNSALQVEILERQNAEASRRELLRGWVQSLEEERRRISRELHDEMGQHLTGFALGLGALEDANICDASTRPLLENLRRMAKEMGREVHRLAVELRPTALDDLGVVEAMKSYVEAWSERTGIYTQFQIAGTDRQHISGELETMLYRAAQEAVNNIAKHAAATEVSVLLQVSAEQVTLIVEDNGQGFDEEHLPIRNANTDPGGLGLIGIRERVSLLGGTFNLESSPGNGTTLFIRAPLHQP